MADGVRRLLVREGFQVEEPTMEVFEGMAEAAALMLMVALFFIGLVWGISWVLKDKPQPNDCADGINKELLRSCDALVRQFDAYPSLVGEAWRTRIGLPDDLKAARAAIVKAEYMLKCERLEIRPLSPEGRTLLRCMLKERGVGA